MCWHGSHTLTGHHHHRSQIRLRCWLRHRTSKSQVKPKLVPSHWQTSDMDGDSSVAHEQDHLEMNEGDRAIREILHLLEDSSLDKTSANSTKTFLHHAILCASLLCLILFIAIIVMHRKYSSLSSTASSVSPSSASSSQSSSSSSDQQTRRLERNVTKDTVIVITDDKNVDTEIVCDNNNVNMYNTTNL